MHRMDTRCVWIAMALILPGLMAGCLGSDALLPSSFEGRTANDPLRLTWPDPIITDRTGNETEAPSWYDPLTHSRFVQQLVPRIGVRPDIVVTADHQVMVTTMDQVQRSPDGGATWEIVYDFMHPEFDDRFQSLGPSLDHDPRLGQTLLHHTNRSGCNELYTSDDGGDSWSRTDIYQWPSSCPQQPWANPHTSRLIVAPPGPDSQLNSNVDRVLYLCVSGSPVSLICYISIDDGRTWRAKPLILDDPHCSSNLLQIPHRFGSPAVHPDGSVILPIYRSDGTLESSLPPIMVPELPSASAPIQPKSTHICDNRPVVAVSQDNGLSWQIRVHDGEPGQLEMEPGLAIAKDGTAYLVYRDANHTIQVLRSPDKFITWEGPFQVSPLLHTLNSHVALAVGDPDRIAVSYYGTRSEQDSEMTMPLSPATADPNSVWHLFTSVSHNADSDEPVFVTQQVTPREGPVQVGCIGGIGCANLGPSIEMTRDDEGRAYVAFIDGCTHKNRCIGDLYGAWQARESQVAVAIQDKGYSLFAEQGILETLGLQFPQPEQTDVAG